MRLKEIAVLLNTASNDLDAWIESAEEENWGVNENGIKETKSLARELLEASNFIESELL